MSDDNITLIPPGKLRCFITGKLRRDTPEENVRQRIARSLVEDYGYEKSHIGVEFPVKIGSGTRKRVDLAVFPPDTEHLQETIKIIIECKREDIKPTDRVEGVAQLKSYMAACLNAQYGMWIGSELQVFEKIQSPHGHEFAIATDIPRFGSDAPEPLSFSDLVPAQEELIAVFKRCHNYIHGNQGLAKDVAFQELLKLIFCKVHDEDTSAGQMRFYISNEERRSEIGQRRLRRTLDEMFAEVQQKYPYIFSGEERIRLDNRVLAYIVSELQRYSLLQTEADAKGAAYEQLVGANLRGDRGEFFTPRNVCEMAVRMAFATFPTEKWINLKILDPASGTAGFLVAVMKEWHKYLYNRELSKWGDEGKAAQRSIELLREISNKHLFGIDFNPMLVRAAQMNLVMHGDGSTNVFHANSLLPPGEWSRTPPNDVYHNVRPESFDIVVTNPPFGSQISIDDPHILDQFELAAFETSSGQRRYSMPPEQLFIERCLFFLKPGGRLAIVLPDSILSNPGLAFLRRWILERTRVIASIDLPTVTFEPYTGTQTSVLLLQKKPRSEIEWERRTNSRLNYEVFMSTPQAVGHDRRGQPYYLRTPRGHLILHDETIPVIRRTEAGTQVEHRTRQRKVLHDDLPEVAHYFQEWIRQAERMRLLNG